MFLYCKEIGESFFCKKIGDRIKNKNIYIKSDMLLSDVLTTLSKHTKKKTLGGMIIGYEVWNK